MLKKTKGKARQSGAVCVVKKSHPVTLEAGLVWVVATIPYHTGWWLCSPCRMRPPALRRSQIWTPWKWWPIRVTLICLFCLFWHSARLGLAIKCFFCVLITYLSQGNTFMMWIYLRERGRMLTTQPPTELKWYTTSAEGKMPQIYLGSKEQENVNYSNDYKKIVV